MLMIIILGTAVLFFTILTIIMITRVSILLLMPVMIVTTSINPKPETLNLQDQYDPILSCSTPGVAPVLFTLAHLISS